MAPWRHLSIIAPRPRPRSRCSARSSADARTSIRAASKAARPASRAIRPPAATSGSAASAKNREIKCAACPQRRFLPVTDDVVRWHLSGQAMTTAAISSWASTPCFRTRPASSWRPISTRRIGRKTRKPSWRPAAAWTCRPPWSGRAPATAGTFGSSSPRPSPPPWRAGSARTSSPKRWNAARTSAWIPTTASSPIKTRCPRADSAI